MPISFDPLVEKNIINSIKDYLNTNVATPYNAQVANTPYSNPLGIQLAKPSDPSVIPVMPLLVIYKPISARPNSGLGMGDSANYLYRTVRIACFPADVANNQPDPNPEFLLRAYMGNAIENALYIPLNSYAGSTTTMVETLEITDGRIVDPIGRPDQILDIERNRFDAIVSFKYPMVVLNG